MIQRCWRLYASEMATLVMAPTNLIRHVSSIWCTFMMFDLDMELHCKWFMLPMTLPVDMPDEGTR